jgi:hypothetical protein
MDEVPLALPPLSNRETKAVDLSNEVIIKSTGPLIAA